MGAKNDNTRDSDVLQKTSTPIRDLVILDMNCRLLKRKREK